jgi:hypothetical protein
MTINEQTRHAMFVRLESVLGEEVALTLMEHLPPVGWAEVATKRDLDQLHVLTQRDISLATAELRVDMAAQTRAHVFAAIGSVVSVVALTLTAVRFG